MNTLRVSQIANATSLAATTSYGFTSDSHRVVAVQAVWTVASASATATLQSSLDNVTWADFVTGTSITASGNKMWNVDSTDALYWRVTYTHVSGSSTTFKAYVANVAR